MKNLFKIAAVFIFFFSGITPAFAARELPSMDDKTISMDLQNANLKDILKIFSIQSGLNFIAAQNVEDRKITLFLDKVPIREGMTKLFEANSLTYDYDESANIYVVKYWGEPQIELLTKIYRLKNRSVASSSIEKEKVALMSASGLGSGLSSASSASAGGPGAESDAIVDIIKQVLSREGKINEDKRTNSIIITDIPSRFPVIDELIARLDTPQPMVLLEVEMLDVNKSVLDRMGFDVGELATPNPLTLNFSKGASFNDIKVGVGGVASGTAGALTFGRGEDFSYGLMLDFLSVQSDTRYLARPKILTINNETAEIGVTKDLIVNVKKTQTTTNGETEDTYEYDRATDLKLTPEGIGIFLRVTPQVNLDTNEITMVVNPKTSSATQSAQITSQVALDPEVRMTKSIVKIKDGQTIVLGGLIHKETSQTFKKVPLLGDIPLMGALFRHKSTDTDVDRELLVFITPRIIREPGSKLAKADSNPEYALQYLSSGIKRKQEVNNLLDVYEEK